MAKAVITNVIGQKLVYINKVNGHTSKVYDDKYNAKVVDFLPFRVKFTTIGINAYGPNNPAPIGIAIIGYSNYVL
jgi:hypothetical protein